MKTEEEDAAMKWIRDVRHKISAEFDHDPRKLGDHYRELEKKYADRLEKRSSPEHKRDKICSDRTSTDFACAFGKGKSPLEAGFSTNYG